jgi:hypothetical protein
MYLDLQETALLLRQIIYIKVKLPPSLQITISREGLNLESNSDFVCECLCWEMVATDAYNYRQDLTF